MNNKLENNLGFYFYICFEFYLERKVETFSQTEIKQTHTLKFVLHFISTR